MNNYATQSLIPATLVCVALALASCSSTPATTNVPSTNMTSVATEEVAVIDTSGSIDGTDLFAAAQNKIAQRVKDMPVGGKFVVGAMNSDVTAVCTDIVVTLPPQNNPQLEARARQANQNAVAAKVPELIKCSQNHGSATELFGGLAETFRGHPEASHIWVFSDLCDTVTIGNICDPSLLHDPAALAAQVPDSLTPHVPATTTITYIGAGRGSELDAASVENLRRVIAAWTDRTGATYKFEAVGA